MGRYDKMRVHNGSGWVQPNNMYAFNGTSWVHYGDNNSYNTNSSYVFNGSAWVRQTLNRSDYTNYDAATDKYVHYPGTDASLTIVSGTLTISTKRQTPSSWANYLYGMCNDNISTVDWWAGTTVSGDGLEDWHTFLWTTPMWIYRMRYMSPDSTYYNAAPKVALVSFRNADGTWTGETTYSHAGYTARNTWGPYWTFNMQTGAGYTGIKLRYYNNTTYKTQTQSTRIGRFSLETGTITSGANWI